MEGLRGYIPDQQKRIASGLLLLTQSHSLSTKPGRWLELETSCHRPSPTSAPLGDTIAVRLQWQMERPRLVVI